MIGKKIKAYLNEKGIKQTFLAKETGLSDSAVSDICNSDRKIDCVEYYKICRALGVPMSFFFEGIEEEE